MITSALLATTLFSVATPADAVVATPAASVADVVVGESDGQVDLHLTLNDASASNTSVRVDTVRGSATGSTVGNEDYVTIQNRTVTFLAGQTDKTVTVQVSDDLVDERQESFTVKLSEESAGLTLERPEGRVSIVDDDDTGSGAPAVFARDVFVDESAGVAVVPVVLGSGLDGDASSGPVSVAFATAGGSAGSGSDFTAVSGTLTFNPGETAKNVVVPVARDNATVDPEGVERFTVNLSALTGGVFGDAVGVVEIAANDQVPVGSPAVSVNDVVVGESDGYVDIAVRLSAPSLSETSLRVQTANGSAGGSDRELGDYVRIDQTVRFLAGQTAKTLRIEITDDPDGEGQESFTVGLGTLSGLTVGRTSATVTIADDEGLLSPGVVGTVTDSITAQPVGGAFVAALRTADFSLAGGATADASGNYLLPLPADEYFLFLIDRTGSYVPGFFTLSSTVTVRVLPGLLADSDPVMAPTRGAIAGTVSQSSPAAVIPGAWAMVSSATGTPERVVVANGTGAYTIGGLATGNHVMVFLDPAGARAPRYFPSSQTFGGATATAVTAGGSATANGSLPTQTAVGTGAVLSGTVTETGTGTPLAGVHVLALRAADLSFARGVVTNASGAYSLNVTTAGGPYKLGFIDSTGLHAMEWHDNQPGSSLFVANSVAAPAITNAALDRTTGSISGTVTDDPSGGAIADAWVVAIGPTGISGGAVTAANGTYTVTGLPPGTYRVEFVDPLGGRTLEFWSDKPDFATATTINVTAGSPVTAINAALSSP